MRGVGRLKYSVFDERLKNKTLLSRKIVKSRATDDFILICQVLLMQTVPGFDLFEAVIPLPGGQRGVQHSHCVAKARGELPHKMLVATVMSNMALAATEQ